MMVLSVSFGLWAWVVKKFGEQNLQSIKDMVTEIKELRKDLNTVMMRVQVIEFRQDNIEKSHDA